MSGSVVYKWRPGARCPVPAAVAGPEIKRAAGARKWCRPEDLLKISRPKAAPLHSAFEWDDSVAGEAYRISQAGYIIRSIVAVEDEDTSPKDAIRAFSSVVEKGEETPSYTETERALRIPDLRKQLLDAALRDMMAFEQRYKRLEELAEVIGVMAKTRKKVRDAETRAT